MEQLVIYIILAVAVTGILVWSMTLAQRLRYDDHYPPPGLYHPSYAYPPPYRQDFSIGPFWGIALIILLAYIFLRYLDNTGRLSPAPQNEEITVKPQGDGFGNETGGERVSGGKPDGGSIPQTYDHPVAPPAPVQRVQMDMKRGWFVQNAAFSLGDNALRKARTLMARFPGMVWIGEKEDETFAPYKVLIGPYASPAEAGAIHGNGVVLWQPEPDRITIFRPE